MRRRSELAAIRARMIDALKADPGLTTTQLEERFQVNKVFIARVRKEVGIPPPPCDKLYTINRECKTPERFKVRGVK